MIDEEEAALEAYHFYMVHQNFHTEYQEGCKWCHKEADKGD